MNTCRDCEAPLEGEHNKLYCVECLTRRGRESSRRYARTVAPIKKLKVEVKSYKDYLKDYEEDL